MKTSKMNSKKFDSNESEYVRMMKGAFNVVTKDAPQVFKFYNRFYDVLKNPNSFRANEILLFSEYSGLAPHKVLDIITAEIYRTK